MDKPLARKEVIARLSKDYGVNLLEAAKSIRVKVVDYSNNPIAPESIAYKVSFTLWGSKTSLTYYPNTVGYQCN
tara:strand:+ start:1601 stop:1822 length:222 start_codon:yes stop_codon:yes gene_type:complete